MMMVPLYEDYIDVLNAYADGDIEDGGLFVLDNVLCEVVGALYEPGDPIHPYVRYHAVDAEPRWNGIDDQIVYIDLWDAIADYLDGWIDADAEFWLDGHLCGFDTSNPVMPVVITRGPAAPKAAEADIEEEEQANG